MYSDCRYAEYQLLTVHIARRILAHAAPNLSDQNLPDTVGRFQCKDCQRPMRERRATETELYYLRKRARRRGKRPYRSGFRAQGYLEREQGVSLSAGLHLRTEGIRRTKERSGYCSSL